MAYTVNNAVNEVITRLNESGNSPFAELPTGTGPSTSPTITSANQIITFLNEGMASLVKVGRLSAWGYGTLSSVTAGLRVVSYSLLTITPANFTMLQAREVYWNNGVVDTRVKYVNPRWFEVTLYNQPIQTNSAPTHWSDDIGGVMLYPPPPSGGTLKINGTLLFPTLVAGASFEVRVPDEAVKAIIAYACWQTALKNLNTPGLPEYAPVFKAEYERFATGQ